MRMFDAEPQIIEDLKDESEILAERQGPGFIVTTARHPTLGKLVIIAAPKGAGMVVETEE